MVPGGDPCDLPWLPASATVLGQDHIFLARGEVELTVEVRGKRYPAVAASAPFVAPRVKGDPRAERSQPEEAGA